MLTSTELQATECHARMTFDGSPEDKDDGKSTVKLTARW